MTEKYKKEINKRIIYLENERDYLRSLLEYEKLKSLWSQYDSGIYGYVRFNGNIQISLKYFNISFKEKHDL